MKHTPLKRRTPLRSRSRRASKLPARCPVCHMGEIEPVAGLTDWSFTMAPGEEYAVAFGASTNMGPVAFRCRHCGHIRLTKLGEQLAFRDADRQQRERVFDRDGWTCMRCGAQGVPLEKAHKVGVSRARNPGDTRMAIGNQEAACSRCHRAEHR